MQILEEKNDILLVITDTNYHLQFYDSKIFLSHKDRMKADVKASHGMFFCDNEYSFSTNCLIWICDVLHYYITLNNDSCELKNNSSTELNHNSITMEVSVFL